PIEFGELGHDYEPISGKHSTAKSDFLHTAESQEIPGHQLMLHTDKTAQLGGRLTNDDARHQRELRHVTANPELVAAHIFVANHQMVRKVLINDGVQLFHLEALGINGPDRLLIIDDPSHVNRAEIDEWFTGHGVSRQFRAPNAFA